MALKGMGGEGRKGRKRRERGEWGRSHLQGEGSYYSYLGSNSTSQGHKSLVLMWYYLR